MSAATPPTTVYVVLRDRAEGPRDPSVYGVYTDRARALSAFDEALATRRHSGIGVDLTIATLDTRRADEPAAVGG